MTSAPLTQAHQPASPARPAQAPVGGKLKLHRAAGTNLALALLFAAAFGGLYLLSVHGGPSAASAAQQQAEMRVDSAIVQLNTMTSSAVRSRAKDLIASFHYDASQRQVPVGQLNRNPFEFRLGAPSPGPQTQASSPAAATDSGDARAAAGALRAVGGLRLQSVLTGGAGATAMISSNLLTVGQQIEGWTVERIESRQVVLRWRDQVHVLRMEEPSEGK
jgi:hypothetical protein